MTPQSTRSESGQVLPITALFMGVLLLFSALAVDVTGVLSAERFYTTTADAAALAGAQDLQKGKTREVTPDERTRAREHAMHVLVKELGASGTPVTGNCNPANDVVDCSLPSTPYLVSIRTPSPECVDCDNDRAVKVTVRHPDFDLSFARLVGQSNWNVESSAVAGIQYTGKYALLALKPQTNYDTGIVLNGSGTVVQVDSGDIGTNTHLVESSGNVVLDPDYKLRHYNDTMKNGKLGYSPANMGEDLDVLIDDPNYGGPAWPVKSVNPTLYYADREAGEVDCGSLTLPTTVNDLVDAGETVVCLNPGVYEQGNGQDKTFKVGSGEHAYLTPGAYLFEGGITNRGHLYGGLTASAPGVVLSTPQDKEMDLESSETLLLNVGDGTAPAAPAQDYLGNEVKTPDDPALDGDQSLVITFHVPKDLACFESDGVTPRDDKSCGAEKNAAVKLAGTSEMGIYGVIYSPTRRVSIRGNSGVTAIDGQIIGWTLEWSGGSTLKLNYPEFEQIGILRLDAACTAAFTPCS